MSFDYDEFFPYAIQRPEQKKAIEFVLDAFLNQKKRVAILDCGTGVGKSAIGVTIARYLESLNEPVVAPDGETYSAAYVLTTQKILQDQYMHDFGPTGRDLMLSIKSSSNYKCQFYKEQSCAESRRILSQLRKQLEGTEFMKCCRGNCRYSKDKADFIEAPLGVTNFSYFLAETMYAKKLKPRGLLIIDEAHNIENELGKFIEVTFSERFAKDVLGCKVPLLKTQEDVFEWVKGPYKTKLVKRIKNVKAALESRLSMESEGFGEYSKQNEMLDKHICKVNRFIEAYDPKNWILNVVRPIAIPGKMKPKRKFEFKPINVSKYSHDTLFQYGGRILMMSATIIDKDVFCESIGLNASDVAFLSIPSPFPVENRKVHFLPVGSMSMNNIDKTLPVLAQAVKMLLDQHVNEKGLIHCVSFKTAQYLFDNLRNDRLLIHDSLNREDVMKRHLLSSEPTVLLSPSMMEGVDLADDASRFQILCKVPFPYLGDAVVKKRMERSRSWYAYQTVKSIVQALGRSVRNENDHAESYILDEDWARFYRMNRSMFPIEFSSTLT